MIDPMTAPHFTTARRDALAASMAAQAETKRRNDEASQAKVKQENAMHTPGPWEVHPTTLHPAVRSVGTANAAPRRICTVGSMNGSPVDERNARLIAAAPELLEALKGLDEAYCRAGTPLTRAERHEDRKRLIAARAAITKATGEPQ